MEDKLVKIKLYRILKHGQGFMMSLPTLWVKDLGLHPGDKVEMYRDLEDRLIIVPKNRTTPNDQATELREKMREQA
jgi:antitoxin component of MazEF toxin-antitoxin module